MKSSILVLLAIVLSCPVALSGQDAPWAGQSLEEYGDDIPLLAIEDSIAKLNLIFENWNIVQDEIRKPRADRTPPAATTIYLFGLMQDPGLLPFVDCIKSDDEANYALHFYRYRLGRDNFGKHLADDMQNLLDQPCDSVRVMFIPFIDWQFGRKYAAQLRRKADGATAELLWWAEEIVSNRDLLAIPQ